MKKSEIKALISQKIKENENGEITASVLAEVLNAVLTASSFYLNLSTLDDDNQRELSSEECLFLSGECSSIEDSNGNIYPRNEPSAFISNAVTGGVFQGGETVYAFFGAFSAMDEGDIENLYTSVSGYFVYEHDGTFYLKSFEF